jgi:hypothetical protein
MATVPEVLTARLLPPNRDESRRVMVDDPAGPVAVRWFPDSGHRRWRCRLHGDQDQTECPHTFAAAVLLAEQLLGLARIPDLDPTAQKGSTE